VDPEQPTATEASISTRDPIGRMTHWLSGRGVWTLFALFLLWFSGWSFLVLSVLEAVVADDRQREVATVAGPLMAAIGALFAFLTAFVIATEWTQHRDAERNVGLEAEAALQFALATRWPGLEGTSAPRALADYLDAVVDTEWPLLAEGRAAKEAERRLDSFEAAARTAATGPGLSDPVVTEMLRSADSVALARAGRVQMARRELPPALFVLAFLSGVVLNLNAIALALQLDSWVGVVIGGLVLVIALDLALVVVIGAPFRGSLRVDARPILDARDRLRRDLA
jgi:hypothetical protein